MGQQLRLTDSSVKHPGRAQCVGLYNQQARFLIDQENPLGYAGYVPGQLFQSRNILDGSQVCRNNDGLNVARAARLPAEKFRRNRVPLLQQRVQASDFISSIGDNVNRHE